MNNLDDRKTACVAKIILQNNNIINDILVIGCGSGVEAAVLAQRLKANVIGIDIEDNFNDEAKRYAHLLVGNAMSLQFPDSSFDFVYSYHTLEHIVDPLFTLKEMSRLLKEGGGYWIGTPNKDRIIGYLGSKTASLRNKIKWNLIDWKAILTYSFENELGAHAGFTATELLDMLKNVFSINNNVTELYYKEIYSKYKLMLNIINVLHLTKVLYPGVYFMGSK